jgi:hypothetical protein
MKPEAKARKAIDRQLGQCGRAVQDYRQMNISASRGVAVREFPLATGDADYLLYVDAKALGVIEAKPEGHTLTGVETLPFLEALETEGFKAGQWSEEGRLLAMFDNGPIVAVLRRLKELRAAMPVGRTGRHK